MTNIKVDSLDAHGRTDISNKSSKCENTNQRYYIHMYNVQGNKLMSSEINFRLLVDNCAQLTFNI